MGQVPQQILMIGSGRLARHLGFYLTQQSVRYDSWARCHGTPLSERFIQPYLVLLAVSDSAISEFVSLPWHQETRLVHFSGSVHCPPAVGFHPLMTFGPELYSPCVYPTIPFVGERGGPDLRDVFPFWTNPFYEIEPGQKALYHALCAIAGNFTVRLWQRTAEKLQEELALPPSVLQTYRRQIFENMDQDLNSALTGPLVRGDWATVQGHLRALESDTLETVYKAFIEDFRQHPPTNQSEHVSPHGPTPANVNSQRAPPPQPGSDILSTNKSTSLKEKSLPPTEIHP